ncbi:hypothetical protein Tco_1397549 [Tanacetum coccineum]
MQDKKPDLSFFHVFGSLYYPTNDNDDLGKLDAKAGIGIFVGNVTVKKAFRIYNKRTQKNIETIHVTFDELTAMASEQFSSGPGLHSMTPATSSSGLVSNPVSQQPCIPLKRDDCDRLFQPMFDEYFNPPSIDAPSTSIPSTQEQEHSLNISQGFEESLKTPIFHDDPLHESLHEDSTSQGPSSNVRQTHTQFEHLGLVSNPVSQQPCIPPKRDDCDCLFQPMFDEYFNPPSIPVSPVQKTVALRAVVLAYDHVGPEVARLQEGKRSQDDDKRLCLVDNLKEFQDLHTSQA